MENARGNFRFLKKFIFVANKMKHKILSSKYGIADMSNSTQNGACSLLQVIFRHTVK